MTSSVTARVVAALAAAVLAAAGGCGSDRVDDGSPTSDGQRSETPETSESPETPAPDAPAVESVTVTRSGGIAGDKQTWKVSRATDGFAPVFDAASRSTLAGIDARDQPQVPCCDRFVYDVVVHYTDGSRTTYVVHEGTTDPALRRLVDAVLKTDPEHPVSEPRR